MTVSFIGSDEVQGSGLVYGIVQLLVEVLVVGAGVHVHVVKPLTTTLGIRTIATLSQFEPADK